MVYVLCRMVFCGAAAPTVSTARLQMLGVGRRVLYQQVNEAKPGACGVVWRGSSDSIGQKLLVGADGSLIMLQNALDAELGFGVQRHISFQGGCAAM